MPVPGSYRARRDRPPSTTIRTSSMVSEVSAIEVASTSFRPAGLGPDRRALLPERKRAVELAEMHVRRQARGEQGRDAPYLPLPGRKARQPPAASDRARRMRSAIASSHRAPCGSGRSSQRVSTG
jgi:hypothetical protein